MLRGRVRSSLDAWILVVFRHVLSRSTPFLICARGVADAGASVQVRCFVLLELCLTFSPGRRLLLSCFLPSVESALVLLWLHLVQSLSLLICLTVQDYTPFRAPHGRHFAVTVLSARSNTNWLAGLHAPSQGI
jgi:hypothetical protein